MPTWASNGRSRFRDSNSNFLTASSFQGTGFLIEVFECSLTTPRRQTVYFAKEGLCANLIIF